MTDRTAAARASRVAAGWLAAQQDVAGRAAHELKNTLNGVAVNLEVVRTRLARPGVQPEQVQRFADAAAGQLELLTRQVEALLSLTRAARDPADVGATLADLLSLRPERSPAAEPRSGEYFTGADAAVVRLLLSAALRDGGVPTVDDSDAGRLCVRVADAPPLDDGALDLAEASGVTVAYDGGPDRSPTLTLIFPARGHQPAETDL